MKCLESKEKVKCAKEAKMKTWYYKYQRVRSVLVCAYACVDNTNVRCAYEVEHQKWVCLVAPRRCACVEGTM